MAKARKIRLARKIAVAHGVDPDVFVRMIQQESGFQTHITSRAGAQGIAQFMPATAQAYHVNPADDRVKDDLRGAARYLKANLKRTGGDYKGALSIYNSGSPTGYQHIGETAAYVRGILNGQTPRAPKAPVRGSGSPGSRKVVRTTTTRQVPDVAANGQARQAAALGYLTDRGPDKLLNLAVALQGANQTKPETSTQTSTKVRRSPMPKNTPSPSPGRGKVILAPGADRAGVTTKPIVTRFLGHVAAAVGTPITITTGTNHNQMTVDGNVSDHWSGHAADIGVPVDSEEGDRIATKAIALTGVPLKQARQMAHKGGLYNLTYHGHRVQVIWKTMLGGDHHNHVHVGIST